MSTLRTNHKKYQILKTHHFETQRSAEVDNELLTSGKPVNKPLICNNDFNDFIFNSKSIIYLPTGITRVSLISIKLDFILNTIFLHC